MSKTEIYNTFEYLEDLNDELILPMVHPNCRCQLHAIPEEPELFGLPGGEKIPKMPDDQFEDFLTGLLSAGYITAAVYDLIMKRRKEKKKQ
jgi:hypothetical protein